MNSGQRVYFLRMLTITPWTPAANSFLALIVYWMSSKGNSTNILWWTTNETYINISQPAVDKNEIVISLEFPSLFRLLSSNTNSKTSRPLFESFREIYWIELWGDFYFVSFFHYLPHYEYAICCLSNWSEAIHKSSCLCIILLAL